MTGVVIDPQASGWRDDGTEGGLIRAELARGNLVQLPWKRGFLSITNNGSATSGLVGGTTNNADGTGTRLSVAVQASASWANSVVVQFWITGDIFGLRYEDLPGPIDIMIDGVGYAVPLNPTLDPRTGFAAGGRFPWGANHFILANDLGPGRHFVQMTFPAFTSGSTRQYLVHGILVDGKAGYLQPGPFVHVHAVPVSITGTNGATANNLSIFPEVTNISFWGWRRILFCNTSGSPVQITAVYSTRTSTPIWSKTIPANDTVELDWGALIADVSNLLFYASTGGVVNATVIGVG